MFFYFLFLYRFSTGEEDILSVEYSKQSLENYQMGEACRKGSSVIRDFSVNYEERVVSKQVTKNISRCNKSFLPQLISFCANNSP